MSSDLSLEKRIVQSQQRFQLLPPDVQASYREQVAAWESKRKAWFAAVKREAALKLLAARAKLEAEAAERDVARLRDEEMVAYKEVSQAFQQWRRQ